MLAMGMTTDPHQMLKYLKKPVGPLIGVFCQFLIMPCITMAAIKIVNFASKKRRIQLNPRIKSTANYPSNWLTLKIFNAKKIINPKMIFNPQNIFETKRV